MSPKPLSLPSRTNNTWKIQDPYYPLNFYNEGIHLLYFNIHTYTHRIKRDKVFNPLVTSPIFFERFIEYRSFFVSTRTEEDSDVMVWYRRRIY